jgi:CDP-diglyceride synthetase
MGGLHKQRIVIMILCILGAISVFLPWVRNSSNTGYLIGIATAGFSSWGALLSLAGAAFIAYTGNRDEPLTGFMKWAALALCGIAALFGIYKVLNVLGLGLILLQIASIGALFSVIYMGDKKPEPKDTPPLQ